MIVGTTVCASRISRRPISHRENHESSLGMLKVRAYMPEFSWQVFPLWTSYVLLPLVSVYAPKATVILLAVGALSLGLTQERLNRALDLVMSPIGVAIICLVGWSGLTTLWSGDFLQSLYDFSRMALIHVLGFAFLTSVRDATRAARRSLCLALSLFCVVPVLLLGLEVATGAGLGRLVKFDSGIDLSAFARATAILAVLTWPALFAIILRTRSFVWPVIFVCAVFVVLTQLTMLASMVSFILGLLAFLAAYKLPGRVPIIVIAIFAVLFVSVPWISLHGVNVQSFGSNQSALPSNWQHRLGIWHYVSGKVLERPLLGYGYDASRRLGRKNVTLDVVLADEPSRRISEPALPLHPHNAPLQIWLELGAVGVALCLALLFALSNAIVALRFHPLSAATATATLVSFFSISSLSYGIWQKWWLATAWIAAATCVLLIREAEAVGSAANRS